MTNLTGTILLSGFVGSEYTVLRGSNDWNEARLRCAEKGDILPWAVKEELTTLSNHMKYNSLKTSWTGIRRTYTLDPRWVDGTKLSILCASYLFENDQVKSVILLNKTYEE